jgi:hypothetical protein
MDAKAATHPGKAHMESPSTGPSTFQDTGSGGAARSTAQPLKNTRSAAAEQADAVAGAMRAAAGELRGTNPRD